MSDWIDQEGYRANVGIILMNRDGELFWAGRAGRPGWQFPQGGILPEESPEEAMYRELEEEIGLEAGDVELIGSTRPWLKYRLPQRYIRRNGPRCIGQKQIWFLLRLAEGTQEFRFDSTRNPEFDRWRWIDYWAPVREVIFFKRTVYAHALDQLRDLAFPGEPPPRPKWVTSRIRSGRRKPAPRV